MKFWDASAIVPLCLDEPWTPLLTQGSCTLALRVIQLDLSGAGRVV